MDKKNFIVLSLLIFVNLMVYVDAACIPDVDNYVLSTNYTCKNVVIERNNNITIPESYSLILINSIIINDLNTTYINVSGLLYLDDSSYIGPNYGVDVSEDTGDGFVIPVLMMLIYCPYYILKKIKKNKQKIL